MPYIRIWIHLIFATKNREPIISNEIKEELYRHIKEHAKQKDIYVDFMNGSKEHIHILLGLQSEQTISKVVQLIKGESSFWLNKNNLIKGKFEWQEEYIAISVSESVVPKVREYIKNQEEHHKKTTYFAEYEVLMKKYGFDGLKPKYNKEDKASTS